MKNLFAQKKYTFFCMLVLLFAACQKSSNNPPNSNGGNKVITNNFNISLSAANKDYDSVSVDVDNDKINDFTIIAYNSTYDSYQEPRTIKASYIYSLQDSTLIAITNRNANSFWSRLYNFGSSSQYFVYAGGLNAGAVIGPAMLNFRTVENYASVLTAFEPVGKRWDCTSSYIYESQQYSSPYYYNESMGDFLNTTQYIGFTIKKANGRHYGWIKLSNYNSCLNIQVISSGYSTSPNQSITAN
jgi:hypothetical protein